MRAALAKRIPSPPRFLKIVAVCGILIVILLWRRPEMKWAVWLPREAMDCFGLLSIGLLLAMAVWKGQHQTTRSLLAAVIILLIAATIFRAGFHLWAFGSLADGDRYSFCRSY